jgi:vancomycin resistance protein YoaR
MMVMVLGLVIGVSASVIKWKGIVLGVKITGVNVGGFTAEEAANILAYKTKQNEDKEILIKIEGDEWKLSPKQIDLEYDLPKTVSNAWMIGRDGSPLLRLDQITSSVRGKTDLPMAIKYDTAKLDDFVASISARIDDPAIEPELIVVQDKSETKIKVERGKDGLIVDQDQLKKDLLTKLSKMDHSPLSTSRMASKVSLDDEGVKRATTIGEALLKKQLVLKADKEEQVISDKELIGAVSLTKEGFDEEKLKDFVSNFAEGVDKPAQNALFKFEEGRALEFRPSIEGMKIDQDKLLTEIENQYSRLLKESVTVEAFIVKTKPAITTDAVNDLGIRELLGRGTSKYQHSIPNRIHNVGITAQRISGVVIAPGETFSFNNVVGDVSGATGYKPAYVIKDGRTVLGDGGGVCQVSTTVFRAALNAGLPILERKAHSYRVAYYEQGSDLGIDSTVFAPSVDLKFKNDTPAHILVQTINDPKKLELTIEIYGTSDGRVAEVSKPEIWGLSSAPAAVYQDDPSLPMGTIKQVDWAAGGAKAKFDYKVTRNGEVLIQKTFYSTYQPWRAVFLRGVGQ